MTCSGSQLIIEALKAEKVDVVFGFPGGVIIPLFDALYGERGVRLVLARHEQGAVHAADGYARSTGRVGVCIVTSGPGATNTVTGLATANFDSVPLVVGTRNVWTRCRLITCGKRCGEGWGRSRRRTCGFANTAKIATTRLTT